MMGKRVAATTGLELTAWRPGLAALLQYARLRHIGAYSALLAMSSCSHERPWQFALMQNNTATHKPNPRPGIMVRNKQVQQFRQGKHQKLVSQQTA
jgi:hypothetical protein